MKRSFIIATAFSIFSFAAVNAQEQAQPQDEQTQQEEQIQQEEQAQPEEQVQPQEQPAQEQPAEEGLAQDNKKEIQFSELPESVQTGFEDSEYAEWEVSKVHEVTTDEGTMYELTVSDGSTEQTIKLDENGQIKEQE